MDYGKTHACRREGNVEIVEVGEINGKRVSRAVF